MLRRPIPPSKSSPILEFLVDKSPIETPVQDRLFDRVDLAVLVGLVSLYQPRRIASTSRVYQTYLHRRPSEYSHNRNTGPYLPPATMGSVSAYPCISL